MSRPFPRESAERVGRPATSRIEVLTDAQLTRSPKGGLLCLETETWHQLTTFAMSVRFRTRDDPMQTMNISLPDPMKQYVEEQVTAGDYSSASEYVRELVRADQKRNAREQLEQTLLASLLEGEPEQATPEFWATLRTELSKRSKTRRCVLPS